jgi:hypothetical protein
MKRQVLCHAWPAVSVPQHLLASPSVASDGEKARAGAGEGSMILIILFILRHVSYFPAVYGHMFPLQALRVH